MQNAIPTVVPQASHPPVIATPPAPGGRRSPAVYVGIALIVVVVGCVAYVLGRGSTGSDGATSQDAGTDQFEYGDGTDSVEPDSSSTDGVDASTYEDDAASSDTEDSSIVVAPTTTIAVSNPVPPEVAGSVELVQRWADAVTSRDWSTARAIRPGWQDTPDETLASSYAGLEEVQIVFVSGFDESLYVASVAHETVKGVDRTNVYCYAITVDTGAGTIDVHDNGRGMSDPIAGWVPADQLSHATFNCAGAYE
ncbi:MAG: hypothetical protein KF906_05475 [Actinobacteria bacterium]|nr:hypothetical protein [Actinomycetota bacterium]